MVRYIKERNAVTLAQTSMGPESMTLQLTDNLDDAIYNYPITVRRPLPTGWLGAVATQSNRVLTSQITKAGSTNRIVFDAVPNAGQVTISRVPLPFSLTDPQQSGTNFSFRLNGQGGTRY